MLKNRQALSDRGIIDKGLHVAIGRMMITPTPEQALACLRMCHRLSNLYQDISLFRFDDHSSPTIPNWLNDHDRH